MREHNQKIFMTEAAQKLQMNDATNQQNLRHKEEAHKLQQKTINSGGANQKPNSSSKS